MNWDISWPIKAAKKREPLDINTYGWQGDLFAPTLEAMRGIAYVCMKTLSEDVSNIEFFAAKKQGDKLIRVENHFFNELMKNPSEGKWTAKSLKQQLVWWRYFEGVGYWYTPEGVNGPVSIDVLPSGSMMQDPGGTSATRMFQIYLNGKSLTVPAKEMMELRGVRPTQDVATYYLKGIPHELESVLAAIRADNQLQQFAIRLVENDMAKPFTLTDPREDTGVDRKEILKKIQDAMSRHFKGLKVLYTGDMQPNVMQGAASSLDGSLFTDSISSDLKARICEAFRIPLPYIEGRYQNRSTSVTVRKTYYDGPVTAMANELADIMTAHFQQWDADLYITYEPVMIVDELEQAQINALNIASGITTPDEIRASLGMGPLPKPTAQDDEADLKKKALGNYERSHVWKAQDRLVQRYTKELKPIIAKDMNDLCDGIEENLNAQLKKDPSIETGKLFDKAYWKKKLIKDTKDPLDNLIFDSIILTIESVGDDPDLIDGPDAFQKEIAELHKEIGRLMSEPVDTIDREAKAKIEKVIQDNPDASSVELKRLMDEAVKDMRTIYTGSRTELIAKQSTAYTKNSSMDKTAKKRGYLKEWVHDMNTTSLDPRGDHQSADGQIADKDGYFTVGGERLRFPTGGTDPGNNINCGCGTFMRKAPKDE